MRRAALLPPPVFSSAAGALPPFKHDVNNIVHIDSPWFPNTNGNPLGLRALATDGVRLEVGGDFTTVNTKPQQGFAQFG